jgi:hypothetical protein
VSAANAIEAAQRMKRGEGLRESPHVVIFKLLEEVERLHRRIASAHVVPDFGNGILAVPGPLIGQRVRLVIEEPADTFALGGP